MFFPKYNKISNVYERDPNTGKIIMGQYAYKVFKELKDINWVGTEKVDGTNIRLCWNGDRVTVAGKREESQIPPQLKTYLEDRFCSPEQEELFEQVFGVTPAVVYGEGYGKGIQACGAKYCLDSNKFIMFDVYFPETDQFLSWVPMTEVADKLGIERVPVHVFGTLDELIFHVASKPLSVLSQQELVIEGLVARPKIELRTNQGRVMCKIKTRDFA